jgi:hypothetical protein
MTYLDVVNSTLVFPPTGEGHWGHFHELGHNEQLGEWTWDSVGEVTCNFFSARAQAVVRNNTDPRNFYGWAAALAGWLPGWPAGPGAPPAAWLTAASWRCLLALTQDPAGPKCLAAAVAAIIADVTMSCVPTGQGAPSVGPIWALE